MLVVSSRGNTMALNSNLRQDIVEMLVNLPIFQSKNGRTAILLTAGLDNALKIVDLTGARVG
jgi:hypothetical protein